ncbi:hypothetical protein INT45_010295 [Circinella minor]|uniref:Uncharacterized protein n=1 Tax=Circinella minor TaxID=1195481 RepID=A0A8H7SBH7_9FUNG|nr:hypothetical protein INT45_010295 [Circinella minor]
MTRPCAREAEDNCICLLHLMAQRLRERLHIEKVFISPQSNSKIALTERDMPRPTIMNKVTGVDGTMQDVLWILLNMFVVNQRFVWSFLNIDYAGLSTDEEDIKEFLWSV